VWQALREANADATFTLGESEQVQRIREFQEQMDATLAKELGQERFSKARQ
jgi:hypothetical protein